MSKVHHSANPRSSRGGGFVTVWNGERTIAHTTNELVLCPDRSFAIALTTNFAAIFVGIVATAIDAAAENGRGAATVITALERSFRANLGYKI